MRLGNPHPPPPPPPSPALPPPPPKKKKKKKKQERKDKKNTMDTGIPSHQKTKEEKLDLLRSLFAYLVIGTVSLRAKIL